MRVHHTPSKGQTPNFSPGKQYYPSDMGEVQSSVLHDMSTKKKSVVKRKRCHKVKTPGGAMCQECGKNFETSTLWSKEPFEKVECKLCHKDYPFTIWGKDRIHQLVDGKCFDCRKKEANESCGNKYTLEELACKQKPQSVLHRADAIINGEKRDAYGDAKKSLSAVAAKWSIRHGIPITPLQVCQDMIDLKQTRLDHKFDADTILDIAGYTGLADQVKDLPCPVSAMFGKG